VPGRVAIEDSCSAANARRILSGRPTTGPFPRPWEWRVAVFSFSKIFSLRDSFPFWNSRKFSPIQTGYTSCEQARGASPPMIW